MKNLIIEGLWNLGKSALAESLLNESYFLNFRINPEPILENESTTSSAERNAWYISKHLSRIKDNPVNNIFDRSIISCAAFHYASSNFEDYEDVSKIIRDNLPFFNEAIIIFESVLEKDYINFVSTKIENSQIKEYVSDERWLWKYQQFYREILPFDFGIVPFEVPISAQDTKEDLLKSKHSIIAMIENDRRCQVNVVPVKEGKILVLQRNEKKGGFWQTITGGIQIKGTFLENVLREVEEELDIIPDAKKLKSAKYTFGYVGGEGYYLREYVYYYELDSDEDIALSDEHVGYEFLSPEQAITKVKWEGNKEAIRKVSELII